MATTLLLSLGVRRVRGGGRRDAWKLPPLAKDPEVGRRAGHSGILTYSVQGKEVQGKVNTYRFATPRRPTRD